MVTYTGETWSAGTGTTVITIPKKVRKFLNIKDGDLLEIQIRKVLKRETSQENTGKNRVKLRQ